MILWCCIRQYFKSFKIYWCHFYFAAWQAECFQGIPKNNMKILWSYERVLLFELRELFPPSHPELTTQGHVLHTMSLGSPRSEGGKNNSLICSCPQIWPSTNISSRETHSRWNSRFQYCFKIFCLFCVMPRKCGTLHVSIWLDFFPFTAIHACAK